MVGVNFSPSEFDDDDGDEDNLTGPPVEDDAARLRRVWVAAVRNFHRERTGQESRYDSNVRWDGGVDPVTRRRIAPVWPVLAARAREAGFEATDLVAVLFQLWTSDSAPTPHMMLRSNVTDVQRRLDARRRQTVTLAAAAEESKWRAAVWSVSQGEPNPEAVTRFVINDLSVSISPAFRYAMAVAAGLGPEAEHWRAQAAYQVGRYPALYRELWSHLLPKELLEAAAQAEVA